jgi:hypothetical protein
MAPTTTRPPRDPEADALVEAIFAANREGRDPCPFYRQLRERHAIYYAANRSMWILTGFAEVDQILCSPAAQLQWAKRMATVRPDWREHQASRNLEDVIAFIDGEPHQKIRKALLPGWTKSEMERLRSEVRSRAESLVNDYVDSGGGNFIEKLAYPMAEDTIRGLFAMDESTPSQLPKLVETFQFVQDYDATSEQLEEADKAAVEIREFWRAEFLKRVRHPGNDMLSKIAVNPAFTVEEGTVIAESLYNGGFESTALTATTGMWLLLSHPEELERARHDSGALERLPNEALRMGGAIPMTARIAVEDIAVGNHIIRRDNFIGVALMAANRDPAVFADPERFDLTRPQRRIMSFSAGVHFCIGHLLARMELFELYRALLQRTKTIELVGEACFRKRQSAFGIDKLDLIVS